MTKIDIVIGANWGDEGKGLTTNALATHDSLVVLSSNSCQRGHTVVHNGKRHVFRHFGSGTLKGATTYLSEKFIINPTLFRQELMELWKMGVYPKIYYHPNCLVATPYDMLSNQIIETARGEKRHGSCGCGVWETIVRKKYFQEIVKCNYSDLTLKFPENFINSTLTDIITYYMDNRLPTFDVMKEFIQGKYTRQNVENDVFFFLKNAQPILPCSEKKFLHSFKHIIFENSQGLLLDPSYNYDIDHTTPANVDAKFPSLIIRRNFEPDEIDVNAYYITRSYFTRHGVGKMGKSGECLKESINPFMEDFTNHPNPWQGVLRYGIIEMEDAFFMYSRIMADYNLHLASINCKINLVITHTNEYISEPLIDVFKNKNDISIFTSNNERTFTPYKK